MEVLGHLEHKRDDLVAQIPEGASDEPVRQAVADALVPVAEAYREAQLPEPYLVALQAEVLASLPSAWLRLARRFSSLEGRDFGLWRGGDPLSRATYVLSGLVIGGLILWAPFIPIWEKWFPFLLAVMGWWLPDFQEIYHRRRYARALGRLAVEVGAAQSRLDGTVTLQALLTERGDPRE